jgi:D-3-phosphoglycerate dehydrogenase / 2-oxoglutarate reductase
VSAGEGGRRPVIAIIGDRFMSPSMFEKALRQRCGDDLEIRSLETPWPDEPMLHGYAEPGMEGLKEYQGKADEVVAHVDGAEIAVTHLAPFSAGILARLPQLRLIAVARGGPVNIDMDAARERQIRVVNTPGRNASAVAEFTIGAMLAETRLITRGHESLRRGEWRGDLYRADITGEELSEMTVGVIGYGHIGTKVVRILKAFGCRILVCDPYVHLSASDLRDGVVQVSLERLLRESDVVTLHARVTSETRGLIGRAQFSAMRRGAYFVNTARGPLVDYEALTDALKSGQLRGAAIETFAVEPTPPDLELLRLENVTLTPHIAGASVKTVKFAAEAAAEEVRRYLAGDAPLNPC